MKAGGILIKKGARLPQGVHIESDPCVAGWKLVRNFDGPALDLAARQAGWTFFCLAGEIKSRGFGFNMEKAAQRATTRSSLTCPE
jgi:hypothetical protein